MGFILTEIAITFNTTIGTAGQIVTAASLAGLLISPFLAALSLKYQPRSLLLTGISLITFSALGCSYALNYISMLILYSLSGLGSAMVSPMIITIVGEKVPEDKQSGTIGLIISSTPMLSTIAGLTITYILKSGWQIAYRIYVFPIILVSLIIAYIVLPKTYDSNPAQELTGISDALTKIIGFRSAVACFIGTTLTMIAWGGMLCYLISLYKEMYGLSTASVGLIWSSFTSTYVAASLLCGRIIPRFGNKNVTYLSSLFMGVAIISLVHVSNIYLGVFFGLLVPFFSALWTASSNALALKQVPEYRGAVMSLNSGSSQLGLTLGSLLGGLAINFGGFSLMGIIFGLVGVTAFIIVYYFTTEN
jgi:predicted MFS family arabinose efflux permease